MAGKGTPFEGMSHEQMLAWLDQANSGEVQSAADKLVNAAKEIRKIADELKIRPQWVEWKGEGADFFRVWAGDLANSAYRLADFSDGSAKWLGEASKAISTAKASIPRDKAGATANLEAARKYHNDPDSQEIASKSRAELAALEANKEKVRMEAVAEMRKLAQAYDQSSTQMDKLERPKFPPPPQTFVPPREEIRELERPGSSHSTGQSQTSTGEVRRTTGTTSEPGAIRGHSGDRDLVTRIPADTQRPVVDVEHPTHVNIDSVTTVPPETQRPIQTPGPTTPTVPNRPEPGLPGFPPSMTNVVPPVAGRTGRVPTAGGPGRQIPGGRPLGPAQGTSGAPYARGGTGQFPHGPTSGTQAGRTLPGQTTGRGMPTASGATGRPTTPGMTGRPTGPGVTGGRPATPGMTGRPTGPGVTGGRPATPGATGAPRATGPGVVNGRPAGPGVNGSRPANGIAGGRPAGPTGAGGRPTAPGTAGGHTTKQPIAGGRQTAKPGSSTGRLPGGTVVGGEAATRGSATTGRPLTTPQSGVVGGAAQQTGRAAARPGAPLPTAPTRDGISGGTAARGSGRRAGNPSSGARQSKKQDKDHRES
ncbi:translation initiation factor IF-2 [Streptomyces sp. NPDC006186]|uniref:translation initiation factor IF-2 n=1 Tax=Streptomyces sp. NPDC006186 TaxID=3155248 RepID=UPI0033A9A6BA